jgi:hypothetical protein
MRGCALVARLGVGALLVAACASTASPDLELDPSVASDFATLAAETFAEFEAAFPTREGCIGTVTLVAAPVLADRATYDPATATMTVRVPASADRLREALVHELAHHVESACPDHGTLRGAFLTAAGFAPTAPWSQGATWEQTPSEVFAEATVEYVLGGRVGRQHLSTVPTEAVAAVASWADNE